MVSRADYGKVFVELELDAKLIVQPYGGNLEDNDFTIVVDGKVAPPVNIFEMY